MRIRESGRKSFRKRSKMLLLLHPAVPLGLGAQFPQSHGVADAHLKVCKQAQQTAVHFHICGHMRLHPPSVCSGPVSAGRGSLPIVCSIRPPFSFFPNKRPIDDLILFFGFLEAVKRQNNAPSGERTIYSPPDAVHHCVRAFKCALTLGHPPSFL